MKKYLFFILLIISLIGCKKEDDSIIDTENEIGYFPLRIGNYWVYQHYSIDSLGIEIKNSRTDSITINRDTVINGKRYYILEGTNYPVLHGKWKIIDLLRDSSGYVVNNYGTIKFSDTNFKDVFYSAPFVINEIDTLYTLSYKMEKVDDLIKVPAGIFNVLNYRGTLMTNNFTNGVKYPRYMNNYYAKNIGKILETYYFFYTPITFERRLIRYKIISN